MIRSLFTLFVAIAASSSLQAAPPNVLLVITDDQGFGDLGVHNNPIVRTPHLDAFAKQSVWLKNFTVSPVCSPTRASLLTGQYNYRTGVVDTYLGRSLMRPDVKTLPEYLAAAGYRTGLFGKWHLGDNYPLRPEDRGFQHTLWCQGGGLAQPSDPPTTNAKTAYFDPLLKKNGRDVQTKGYCTDVFTDAALDFIQTDSKKPFFAYVAFNAPHGPYQVKDELVAPYKKLDLTVNGFPKLGQPWASPKLNTDEIARAYAMIENVDANYGRLMKLLHDKKLADNTIVIFLTDNGPGGVRFNGGLRNRKGTVYEGGIRVPCYVRFPGSLPNRTLDLPLAHIDLAPTILDACKVEAKAKFDGENFHPHLLLENAGWRDRTLFTQWHRGDVPEKLRAFAARGAKYKLVQANSVDEKAKRKPKFELFDIEKDPFEEHDLVDAKPDEVEKLKAEYEAWFADVTKKGFDPPRIIVGNEKENPVRLSRQDWRGPKAGWAPDSIGHWEIQVERAGKYRVAIRSGSEFAAYEGAIGDRRFALAFADGTVSKTTETFELKAGVGRVEVVVSDFDGKSKRRGADYVEIEFLGK